MRVHSIAIVLGSLLFSPPLWAQVGSKAEADLAALDAIPRVTPERHSKESTEAFLAALNSSARSVRMRALERLAEGAVTSAVVPRLVRELDTVSANLEFIFEIIYPPRDKKGRVLGPDGKPVDLVEANLLSMEKTVVLMTGSSVAAATVRALGAHPCDAALKALVEFAKKHLPKRTPGAPLVATAAALARMKTQASLAASIDLLQDLEKFAHLPPEQQPRVRPNLDQEMRIANRFVNPSDLQAVHTAWTEAFDSIGISRVPSFKGRNAAALSSLFSSNRAKFPVGF